MSTRKIEVDEEVYRALQKLATPFEDTPNTVLRRLLGLDESNTSKENLTKEAELEEDRHDQVIQRLLSAGGLTAERAPSRRVKGGIRIEEFRIPILEVLVEKGGRASMREVLDILKERMKDRFKPEDLHLLSRGDVRWEIKAQWERYHMVLDGLLRSDSPRGIWEISEKGREFLRKFRESIGEGSTTNSFDVD